MTEFRHFVSLFNCIIILSIIRWPILLTCDTGTSRVSLSVSRALRPESYTPGQGRFLLPSGSIQSGSGRIPSVKAGQKTWGSPHADHRDQSGACRRDITLSRHLRQLLIYSNRLRQFRYTLQGDMQNWFWQTASEY